VEKEEILVLGRIIEATPELSSTQEKHKRRV
jgi:hypothetical protein